MPTPAPTMPNRSSDRPEDGDFKTELLALIPFLRAFARSLTGNQEGVACRIFCTSVIETTA
jgi:hypothetical protein